MIDHLQDRTGDGFDIGDETSQHHEAEVAHRGIGDQFLDVILHQSHACAEDDSDHRQPAHQWLQVECSIVE